MNDNRMTIKTSVLTLIACLMLASASAYADRDNRRHHDRGHRGEGRPVPEYYRHDNRYHLDRYYPRHGHIVNTLPRRHYSLHYHNKNYFYFGGIWYRPSGPRFVVVAPPVGVVVPFLPPYYATLWIGGIPYYYANNTYYVWRPNLNGYEVTQLPGGNTTKEPELAADQLFIYPKEGQSEQQQADDRYECYRWSVSQTGYDPTRPPENLSQSALNAKREDYNRAMRACLEGRGYSVR
jgi:hypothetical protein